MLYTVHTSFSALHTETGYIRGYSVTEKIDAPDKFTAKTLAWHHIVCGGEYPNKQMHFSPACLPERGAIRCCGGITLPPCVDGTPDA